MRAGGAASRMASMRICSLLPSSTEIVFALGLGDRLAGVTHECDFPAEAASIPAVTRSLIDHSESSSAEIHRHVSEAVHAGSTIYGLDQALLERIDPSLVLTQEALRRLRRLLRRGATRSAAASRRWAQRANGALPRTHDVGRRSRYDHLGGRGGGGRRTRRGGHRGAPSAHRRRRGRRRGRRMSPARLRHGVARPARSWAATGSPR